MTNEIKNAWRSVSRRIYRVWWWFHDPKRRVAFRVRQSVGHACLPVFAWIRRNEVRETDRQLGQFRFLCAEWHRLASADRETGVSYRDGAGAGHRAYLAVEAEVLRLRDVPVPGAERWYGFGHSSGLSGGKSSTYGDLAAAVMLHGWNDRFVPLTRREVYFFMGWRYEPPPTEQETAAWGRMFRAMQRMENRHVVVQDVGPFKNVHTVFMGKEYFTELVANLREIEAEENQSASLRES